MKGVPETFGGVRMLPPWTVCGRCYRLRGYVDGQFLRLQCCRCDVAGERWPWDIDAAWQLCRTCGLDVLRDGSRWSVWLCDTCKPLAVELNTALGRPLVPIGRHSIMNGVFYRAADGDVDRFTDDICDLFDKQGDLLGWAAHVVALNLAAFGSPAGADMMLEDYIEHTTRSGLRSRDRFDAYIDSIRKAGL